VIVAVTRPSSGVIAVVAAILVGMLILYLAGRRLRPNAGRPLQLVAIVFIALLVGHLVLIGLAPPLKRLFQPITPPLGITVRPTALPREVAESLRPTQREALKITWVRKGSRADRAGIAPGDVMLAIDGQATSRPRDVSKALRRPGARGDSLVALRLLRGGRPTQVWVRLTAGDVRSAGGHYALLLGAILASIIVWVLAFALLNRLPAGAKKRLIVIATFVAGLFYSIEYFLPAESPLVWWRPHHSNPLHEWLGPWGTAAEVIAGFTIGLGVINLVMIHAKVVGRLRRGWPNSLAFFAALVAMLVFGLWQSYLPATASPRHIANVVYRYLFDGFYVALGAAVFSVLAFYIATAAYRAFRIRTAEAGFMMAAAFIVMLGQIPLGMWVTGRIPVDSPFAALRVESMSAWILGVINMAGSRAILFGVAVGALAMSLRIWLNLERGAFFDQEM
jgi:hypothetical protein